MLLLLTCRISFRNWSNTPGGSLVGSIRRLAKKDRCSCDRIACTTASSAKLASHSAKQNLQTTTICSRDGRNKGKKATDNTAQAINESDTSCCFFRSLRVPQADWPLALLLGVFLATCPSYIKQMQCAHKLLRLHLLRMCI